MKMVLQFNWIIEKKNINFIFQLENLEINKILQIQLQRQAIWVLPIYNFFKLQISNNKNYKMERFIENINSIKQRVEHGTSMCPQKQYPFMMFKCGLLFNKLCDLNKVMTFMEAIEYLKAQGRLTETFQGHLMSFLYQHPEQYYKVSEILDNIIRNKSVNILLQLQKLEEAKQNNNNVSANNSYQASQPNNQQNKLTKTGTLLIEAQVKQMDNQSEKTQKFDQEYYDNVIKMNLESQALAKQLQEEQQKLAKIQNGDDETLCQICYVGLYDQQFLPLQACGHIFHKNCLSEFFKAQISENRFPLKCANDKCGKEVKDRDIKQILASQLYNKYQKHTLKHYADMHGDSISWCPTANCQYMFFFEKDDEVRFQCLQCKKQYCLNCRVDWHKDMSCKQYQISNTHNADDQAFMKFVKGKKFKQCPKCKFWVQKNEGCDHMTCKCKFQFCYKCGGVYMKCQCVAKMQQQMQRRREMIQQRRRKKQQMIQRKRNKKAQPAPEKNKRSTRSRR